MGSALLEANYITQQQLEEANDILVAKLKSGNWQDSSLLKILLFDLNAFQESILWETSQNTLIDIASYNIPDPKALGISHELCKSTWCLPFGHEEKFYFIATSYSLCKPAIDYWEDKLDGKIIWYTTPMESLIAMLHKLPNTLQSAISH